MAQNLLSNRPDYGRTFNTAMWVVGFVAAVQVLIAAWAVVLRAPSSSVAPTGEATALSGGAGRAPNPADAVSSSGTAGQQGSSPGGAPTAAARSNAGNAMRGGDYGSRPASQPGGGFPASEAGSSNAPGGGLPEQFAAGDPSAGFSSDDFLDGEAPAGDSSGNGQAGTGEFAAPSGRSATRDSSVLSEPPFYGPGAAEPSLSQALSEASFTTGRIEDPILERFVSLGEEHRADGHMQAALEALRKAEAELPDHPRVLGELAATLSQMGLDGKADAYWERLLELGPGTGGSYYELAKRQLQGEAPAMSGSPEQVLSIAQVKVNEEAPGSNGQRVSLRIGIDAPAGVQPSGADLSLLVYFYDRVDGKRIAETTADTSFRYPTEPYDWSSGTQEEIVVVYQQPVFTEEQKRDLGERRYYGYAIELYYEDRLQDTVVMPEDITEVRSGESRSTTGSDTLPGGPEDALFPE